MIFIYFFILLLSTLGMGWRIWLEWGEYSLAEHMNIIVIVGYPIAIASFIALSYRVCGKLNALLHPRGKDNHM